MGPKRKPTQWLCQASGLYTCILFCALPVILCIDGMVRDEHTLLVHTCTTYTQYMYIVSNRYTAYWWVVVDKSENWCYLRLVTTKCHFPSWLATSDLRERERERDLHVFIPTSQLVASRWCRHVCCDINLSSIMVARLSPRLLPHLPCTYVYIDQSWEW